MNQVKPWCNLPYEILSIIVLRLSVREVIVLHAVCKWWSGTPLPINPPLSSLFCDFILIESPFLLLPSNNIIHPIYKLPYHMQVCEFLRGYIRASHCGWLLMTLSECSIFFINPFTNQKIELPDMPFTHRWPNLTFSSPLTSPDCLVFGVQQEPCGLEDMINIYTIKPEGKYWTIDAFHCNPYFELSSCNPVLFKDLYYCLGKGGSLLIYDPTEGKHRWMGPPEPPLQRSQSLFGCQYYMVESQGKLFLVFTDREGQWVKVSRHTTKKRFWETVDSLGDATLFVSQITSFSEKSVVGRTGNKIYFTKFVDDRQLFYSLDTRKYHCIDGGPFWKSFEGTTSYPNSTWIRPFHLLIRIRKMRL